jgi:membrane protease YdiL (CAAX protease family)
LEFDLARDSWTVTSSTDDSAGQLDRTASNGVLTKEVWLVLALSLGASGVSALISFTGVLTSHHPLGDQTAVIVGSRAPGRPWLDLAWQVFAIVTALVPVALVAHLLARGGESLRTLGFDRRDGVRDLARGAAVAACVGGAGLAFYLVAVAVGLNLTVDPAQLPGAWWRVPVLIAVAAQNAVLEEVIVLGYLNRRLEQLGWSFGRRTTASAVLRGSYHLYQGFGGFIGNLVMGLVFGRVWQRTNRLWPLVVAHTLLDVVSFVGYSLLKNHISWLP